MDALYYFVLAVIFATVGISFVIIHTFKNMAKSSRDEAGKIQTKMFIYIPIVEIVPIILFVTGFLKLQNDGVSADGPLLLIILFWFVSSFVVVKKHKSIKKEINIDERVKPLYGVLLYLSLSFLASVPILGIVGSLVRMGIIG